MPTPPSTTIVGSTTLSAIQTKVRRLTRKISENQLSTADLNTYINTFVVYDFPEQLRTFNLRVPFTFWCNPYQDVYQTDTSLPVNDPLYNFKNKYLTVHPPVYVAGFNVGFSQDRAQFFGAFPFSTSIQTLGQIGNGVTSSFTGFINAGQLLPLFPAQQKFVILKNQVLFSSIDANNNGLALVDTPLDPSISNTFGNLSRPDQKATTSTTVLDPFNFINYVTGAYTIQFGGTGTPVPPGPGQPINSQTVSVSPSRPSSILYSADTFTLRSVPNQPYAITFEVYQRPTALLDNNQSPELEEYWQYIAYGAAKKIFEDQMDLESVQMIMPEFKTQEILCLRRTLVQYANGQAATIYGSGGRGGNNGLGGSNY